MICNREFETMTREDMNAWQAKRLKVVIDWLWEKSAYYRTMIEEAGMDDKTLTTFEDLSKLPLTTKTDLEDLAPFGLLTFPMSTVERIHILPGARRHLAAAHTNGDIGKWLEMLTRPLIGAYLNASSVLGIVSDYGENPDGLALHYAAEVIGAAAVPLPHNIYRQVDAIRKLSITSLGGSAEDLWRLGHALKSDRGMVEQLLSIVRSADDVRSDALSELYGVPVVEILAIDELMGAGVGFACGQGGWHLAEDAFYAEGVDADGKLLADGEEGELVLTNLVREAMPVLRYRTGLIGTLSHEPCACGRTSARFFLAKKGE